MNIERSSITQQILNQLKADLDAGRFRVGERWPSDQALADRFQVSRATISKVRLMLGAYGYLGRGEGKDTVVLKRKR